MSRLMEYVEILSEKIGPRPATSEAEYQAAEWLSEKFSQHRIEPEIQNFRAPATYSWAYVIYHLLTIIAAVTSGLMDVLRPVALVLAIISAVLLYMDMDTIWGISHLFARRPSQNVIAKHQPRSGRSERSRKIVIVSHYDSARSSLAFSPAIVKGVPLGLELMKWCTWLVPVFIIAQFFVPDVAFTWVWYATMVASAYLLFPLVVNVLRELIGKHVEGANDNASGVAAMLGVLDAVAPVDIDEAAAAAEEERFFFGARAAQEAQVAPEEASIEYAQEASVSRETQRSSEVAVPPVPPAPAPDQRPSGVGSSDEQQQVASAAPEDQREEGQQRPVSPHIEKRIKPKDEETERQPLPLEGFPADLTVDTPIEKPHGNPAAVRTPSNEPLRTDIPSMDEISMPGETQAFTPIETRRAAEARTVRKSAQPSVTGEYDLDSMLSPVDSTGDDDDEWGTETYVATGATEEFDAIPDSRVRELGSQVTGVFSKIFGGKRKKHTKDNEEEALDSWFDSNKSKKGSSDPWMDDDDDDDGFGWRGGAAFSDDAEELSTESGRKLNTEERIRFIKERVLSVADRDLLDKEVWFVATGAEEVGTFGMQAFLKEYGSQLRGAMIINLDNIGAGELYWITSEGMVRRRKADRRLQVLARRISRNENIPVKPGKFKGLSTDGSTALAKGYKAMTVMALDGPTPPNWHWQTDTIENIDPDNLENTVKLVTGMIRES